MHALLWVLILSFLALATYQSVHFYLAKGTVAQRLAAAWQDSLTQFVNVWGFFLAAATAGLDELASATGDPEFTQAAEAVKAIIPVSVHPYIPLVVIGGSWLARKRTLPKGK